MQIPKRRYDQRPEIEDPYLTRGAIAELELEVQRLREKSRPRVLAELQAAQALGDLSENAAYSIAKGRLRGIDERILVIGEKLKRAIPIEEGSPDGVVRIGSRVTVRVNGAEKTYLIVGSQEADPSAGKLSHLSPVGAALMGHEASDTVIVSNGDREVHYEIVRVA